MINKKYALIILMIFITALISYFSFNAVTSAAGYDFVYQSITANPANPPAFVDSEIKVKILYYGDNLTDTSLIDNYYYSFPYASVKSVSLPSVSASNPVENGETFDITFTVEFSDTGSVALNFTMNDDHLYDETNSTNNDGRKDITVVAPDDLYASSITVYPDKPTAGEDCKITVKVKNNGYRDIISSIGVQDYSYDFFDFTVSDTDIPARPSAYNVFEEDEIIDYVFYGKFGSGGSKSLSFTINDDERLDENNFSNNTLTKSVTVASAGSADVSVTAIEFDVDEERLIKNTNVVITVDVKNVGETSIISCDGISSGDIYYKFNGINILTTLPYDCPSFTNPFDKNEILEFMFTGTAVTPGEHELIFRIDKSNELIEANEINNEKIMNLTIYSSAAEADDFSITNMDYAFNSNTSAIVTWNTAGKETDGYVKYKKKNYTNFSLYDFTPHLDNWPASNNVESHQATMNNLQANTSYDFQIFSSLNTVEKGSAIFEFTTPASDIPQITEGPAVAVSGNSATITYKTSLLAKSTCYYKIVGSETYLDKSIDSYKDSHSTGLSGLALGDYEFYIKTISKNSKSANSLSAYFTVGAASGSESSGESSGAESATAVQEVTGAESSSNPDVSSSGQEITNSDMYARLKGKIVLQVEAAGEAYYIHPTSQKYYYLGRPDDAFSIMRQQGIGITTADLNKIPIGLAELSGDDTDADGLSDLLEDAIGTDKNNKNSDGDAYDDKTELLGGYNPTGEGNMNTDSAFANTHKGKIFLQVEGAGEAWYINNDGKRYFLGRPADAFSVMRNLGLGISNNDFNSL